MCIRDRSNTLHLRKKLLMQLSDFLYNKISNIQINKIWQKQNLNHILQYTTSWLQDMLYLKITTQLNEKYIKNIDLIDTLQVLMTHFKKQYLLILLDISLKTQANLKTNINNQLAIEKLLLLWYKYYT